MAAALVTVAIALWQLAGAMQGVAVAQERVGEIPVEIFSASPSVKSPVVVIAHGFAGSRQLMHPFATTLARNGYVAVTFDLPGHARNRSPLPGGLVDHEARSRALVESVAQVAAFAKAHARSDGRVAVLGHSMASDVVVRYARAHPEVVATVAVSLYSPGVSAESPRNLLVIDGAWEPAMLTDEGLRVVGMATRGPARAGVTYGRFEDGTARRLVLAQGVEHIGVLYSRESQAEARDWLHRAFGQQGNGYVDGRGPWIGLLYLGLVVLAWSAAHWLPRVSAQPQGAGLQWREFLPIAIAPAILTPLILWPVPHGGLPILLGDYLALHFGLYGALTFAGLWFAKRNRPALSSTGLVAPVKRGALALAALGFTAFLLIAFGIPTDRYAISFALAGDRAWLAFAILAGTLLYFVADEWLTRGSASPRGAYALSKFAFLVSLAFAIALDLPGLFFLLIIVPAILAFFIVFGVLSAAAYRRTHHPFVGAAANAVVFAWAIAASFPIVAR